MTAITVSTKLTHVQGDLKFIVLVTDANAATGHTYDASTDFQLAGIMGTSLQNTTGTTVASCTWSNSTNAITLPSISTGVHKLTVWGY